MAKEYYIEDGKEKPVPSFMKDYVRMLILIVVTILLVVFGVFVLGGYIWLMVAIWEYGYGYLVVVPIVIMTLAIFGTISVRAGRKTITYEEIKRIKNRR